MEQVVYTNTFIAVAQDCKVSVGTEPPARGTSATVAQLQFGKMHNQPFETTMEDVLFGVWAERQGHDELAEDELEILRAEFFSKGQPCFRASPLAKNYGWGFLFDEQGRVAMLSAGSAAYDQALERGDVKQLKAMRSKRA